MAREYHTIGYALLTRAADAVFTCCRGRYHNDRGLSHYVATDNRSGHWWARAVGLTNCTAALPKTYFKVLITSILYKLIKFNVITANEC